MILTLHCLEELVCLVFVLVNLNPQPRTMSSAIPPKMKAVRFHQTGGPEVIVLEEIDIPDPSPEDVLIKVEWAGVNYSESPISCSTYVYLRNIPIPSCSTPHGFL